MGTVEIEIAGVVHFWDTIGNLHGWFTQDELDGTAEYPSQRELDRREMIIEDSTDL